MWRLLFPALRDGCTVLIARFDVNPNKRRLLLLLLLFFYTAWWQRHIGVNNLPKVVTRLNDRAKLLFVSDWTTVQRTVLSTQYSILYWADQFWQRLTDGADGLSMLFIKRQFHQRCYRWPRMKLHRTYKHSTISAHSVVMLQQLVYSTQTLDKLSLIEDRGQTDRVDTDLDVWPWFSMPGELSSWPTHSNRKRKFEDQLVTQLVWPHQPETHRGGLGLGGLVHEEAHPCFSYFIQTLLKRTDAGSTNCPLIQLIPSVNYSVRKKYSSPVYTEI